MTVNLIEFHLPNGRKTESLVDLNDDLSSHIAEMRECDCRFEIETLTTGESSLTITNPLLECDLDIRLMPDRSKLINVMEYMLIKGVWKKALLDYLFFEGEK